MREGSVQATDMNWNGPVCTVLGKLAHLMSVYGDTVDSELMMGEEPIASERGECSRNGYELEWTSMYCAR